MSEESKAGDNGKPDGGGKPVISMSIALDTNTNNLSVKAPGNSELYDIPMSLYLMDMAKDHIKAVNRAKTQSRIVQPRPRIKDIFRGRR